MFCFVNVIVCYYVFSCFLGKGLVSRDTGSGRSSNFVVRGGVAIRFTNG